MPQGSKVGMAGLSHLYPGLRAFVGVFVVNISSQSDKQLDIEAFLVIELWCSCLWWIWWVPEIHIAFTFLSNSRYNPLVLPFNSLREDISTIINWLLSHRPLPVGIAGLPVSVLVSRLDHHGVLGTTSIWHLTLKNYYWQLFQWGCYGTTVVFSTLIAFVPIIVLAVLGETYWFWW